MTNNRVLMLAAVVLGALAWTLPATAAKKHVVKAQASVVTVAAGKPSEFRFTLSKKAVPHGVVTFKVTNDGTVPHDFKIAGKKTPLINPGQTKVLRVVFKKAGKYPYLCTVSGHAAAGMKGVLVVK